MRACPHVYDRLLVAQHEVHGILLGPPEDIRQRHNDLLQAKQFALLCVDGHTDCLATTGQPSMERKSKRERVARLRQDQLDELGGTQSACVRWVDDHWSGLSEADPDVPSELHDRAGDNWRPLLAIAEEAGGEWPVSAGKAARLLSGMEPDDDDNSVVLLADIRDVFEAFASDVVASQALVESLVAIAERPWAEWRGGREMSQHQLARVLKPFRIHPKQVRVDGVQKRGYRRKDFEDAWLRHLPERGST